LTQIITISLTRLILWSDPTRIQSWPALISEVPFDVSSKSLMDFGRLFITERMTDPKHSAAEMITRNLPGIEQMGENIVLKGVGLLERRGKEYRLSNEGKTIADAYKSDPQGMDWVKQLATLLLTKEPRTRIFIKMLSSHGSSLQFERETWFGGSTQKAKIQCQDGTVVAPFLSKDGAETATIRVPIDESAWWALGEWRSHKLISGASDCKFRGRINEKFSLNGIGTALRSSCEVFAHLGILKQADSSCWLDQKNAIECLGTDLAEDFGWVSNNEPPMDVLALIKEVIGAIRSDTGFIVASELREALQKYGVKNPDAEIARFEETAQLVIDATDYGQSRHGKGLYGDSRKQLIKIRVF
jgi:hypothetical protein